MGFTIGIETVKKNQQQKAKPKDTLKFTNKNITRVWDPAGIQLKKWFP